MKKLMILLAGCTLAFAATADMLECTVTDKTDNGRKYTPQQVAAGKYSYKIDNNDQKPKITRCAYSAKEKKVLCSNIRIERVGTEPTDQLKRFYYNRANSNFHLEQGYSFKDNLTDKSFNFGTCKAVKK
ncbi:MAG: hypothetical protein FGM35_07015 [Rhodocyclaceae bacterium]|jgi:hypothetical protein|nr:hypothetical protein [Rhodocyclaceae bacterium]